METTILSRLAEFADQQYGYVTRTQAASVGAPVDQLLAAGFAEPATAEVIRLRAGGRSAYPRMYAAWLELAPAVPAGQRSPPGDGVVSHDSALRLYRVAGEPGPAAEFTIAGTRPDGAAVSAGTILHTGAPTEGEWTWVAGLPVTRPARTLIDLSGRYDVDELARMAASLVGQGWTDASELRAELTRGVETTPPAVRPAVVPDQWIAGVLAEVRRS